MKQSEINIAVRYAIPYLTCTAVLSQIAFWSVFNLNVFEFVTVADIITTFIYPTLFNAALLVAPIVVLFYRFKKEALSWVLYFLLFGGSIILLNACNPEELSWNLYTIAMLVAILAGPIWTKVLDRSGETGRKILYALLLIYFPVMSFLLSRSQAWAIIENVRYTEVIFDDDPDKFKHLGNVGDFIIVLATDNTRIVLKNKNDVHTVYLNLIEAEQIRIRKGGENGGNPSPTRPPGSPPAP